MTSHSSERTAGRSRRALLSFSFALALAAACAGAGLLGHRVVATAPTERIGNSLELLRSIAPEARLGGEHGLVVRVSEDSLEVRWLTDREGPGLLRTRSGDRVRHVVETPAGHAHAAVLERPGSDRLRLEYGSLDVPDDRHVTVLRLDATDRAEARIDGVDSIYVVGDVHGEYETLGRLLENAGLVDGRGRWSGGGAHLVLLGDIFDRGPDVTKTLWFLYGLQDEARAAGGRVHVVLGNHEVMVLTGDLRYVSAKEQALAVLHGISYPNLFDVRETVLGRWLASRPGVLRIDDVLLAHGGVADPHLQYGVEEFNDSLAAFMGEELFSRWGDRDTTYVSPLDSASYARRVDFFFDDRSVFWFRGYVTTDTAGGLLARVLQRYEARIHVVAHTPVSTIEPRYGGRLVPVDLDPAATEMLRLERAGDGYRAYRHGLRGEPDLLEGVR